jgi:uncharacterized protein YybS (DUF2232 family)
MENNREPWDIDPLEENSTASESANLDESVNQGSSQPEKSPRLPVKENAEVLVPLVMVETAFLASTGSLIWLFDYYFPLGPLLRIFFPIPIALVYLRWGSRASWMAAIVSGLLLSVLMGPTRSVLFFIPYGVMGVQLGYAWRRGASWLFSIATAGLIGTFGLFFRFWLVSILIGEDLWTYLITQMTALVEWIFLQLGWLFQLSVPTIQAIAIGYAVLINLVYVFVVHLVALLLLDRLGNPIPRPPAWVQVLLDYEE